MKEILFQVRDFNAESLLSTMRAGLPNDIKIFSEPEIAWLGALAPVYIQSLNIIINADYPFFGENIFFEAMAKLGRIIDLQAKPLVNKGQLDKGIEGDEQSINDICTILDISQVLPLSGGTPLERRIRIADASFDLLPKFAKESPPYQLPRSGYPYAEIKDAFGDNLVSLIVFHSVFNSPKPKALAILSEVNPEVLKKAYYHFKTHRLSMFDNLYMLPDGEEHLSGFAHTSLFGGRILDIGMVAYGRDCNYPDDPLWDRLSARYFSAVKHLLRLRTAPVKYQVCSNLTQVPEGKLGALSEAKEIIRAISQVEYGKYLSLNDCPFGELGNLLPASTAEEGAKILCQANVMVKDRISEHLQMMRRFNLMVEKDPSLEGKYMPEHIRKALAYTMGEMNLMQGKF